MLKGPMFTRRSFVKSGVALASVVEAQRIAQAVGVAPNAPVCGLVAEQEIGPYYIANELLRSNIREDKPGVPLSLRIVLLDSRTCRPLPDAAVDVWHCDALGLYSGFVKQSEGRGPGGPPPGGMMRPPGPPPDGMMGPPQNHPTDKLTFLRGIQLSNENGIVDFQTVFPGFYMGRTNHIHFKVRVNGHSTGKTYQSGHTSHTGQIFFPEELAVKLMDYEPYRQHAIHRTTQAEDDVYNDQKGSLSIARLAPAHASDIAAGLTAELIAALDPTASPMPAQRGPQRGRRPMPPPGE
jgi:protocatechuate 3,4-dioxygenase beta subunit